MKVLLTQPNYSRFKRRSWKYYPYSLGILNACIKDICNSDIFDPNLENLNDETIIDELRKINPDIVGITTVSVEYIKEIKHMTSLIKEAIPSTILIEGGIYPTSDISSAIKDKNVDYFILGEGEFIFRKFLEEFNTQKTKERVINKKIELIDNLDSIPFPDYGSLDILKYANQKIKMGGGTRPKRNPYAITITSRGCCYNCTFCAGPKISGRKVRMRSANNVLNEIDKLYRGGIKEIIFLDDHFFFDKNRAIDIMEGLIKRKYDLLWKCLNISIASMDENLIHLMKESGCYQVVLSIESGNQYVLKNIMKKYQIKLDLIPKIIELFKKYDIEILSNWVIGFPKETWDQIMDTINYSDELNVDGVQFHIATPLPKTELMEECIQLGYLPKDVDYSEIVGFTKGIINTDEFSSTDLQILRAYEWDRINFKNKEKREKFCKIQGITMEELYKIRKETRNRLGVVDESWGKKDGN